MTIESLYEAYWVCRKNKANTHNAMNFEVNYEMNLLQLHSDVVARTYRPGRSIAFIITKPVQREIFAADFRDRIIHHWMAMRLEPMLEAEFIDETFNCRRGKGNSAGIECLHQTIKECSDNYTSDCWVMKLDLQSFFTSINRRMLCNILCRFISDNYTGEDKDSLLFLSEQVMMNEPETNCIRKGSAADWDGLPPSKSLFTNKPGHGLPIGNLTSQLTGNLLLNETDHFIRDTLGLRMGRYVDDYFIVDSDKQRLLNAVPLIRDHLKQTAGATLHPDKFYLQHYTKGVKFIGAVVKRERIYISNRTVSNAYKSIRTFNRLAVAPGYAGKNAERFASSINSYLGIMIHYRTYNARKRLIGMISPEWLRVITIASDCSKVTVKPQYKHRDRIRRAIRKRRKVNGRHYAAN